MKTKLKWIASILVLSMIFSMIPKDITYADESNRIFAWFSNDETGGYYYYAHPGQTVTLNYQYIGYFDKYKVKISVKDEGNASIFFDTYTNIVENQINIPLPEEEGIYTASIVVSSGMNEIKTEKQIETVKDLPTIITQPTSVVVDMFEPATYEVRADGSATYQWYRSDKIDEEGSAISGATKPIFTVTSENVVSSANESYYYCQITTNGKSILSNFAKLTIRGCATATPVPKPTAPPYIPTATPIKEEDIGNPTSEPIGVSTQTPNEENEPTIVPDAPIETNLPIVIPTTKPNIPQSTLYPSNTNIPNNENEETPYTTESLKDDIGRYAVVNVDLDLNDNLFGNVLDGKFSYIEQDDEYIIPNIIPNEYIVFASADGSTHFYMKKTDSINRLIWVYEENDLLLKYQPTINEPIPTPNEAIETKQPSIVVNSKKNGDIIVDIHYEKTKNRVICSLTRKNGVDTKIRLVRKDKGKNILIGTTSGKVLYDKTVNPNKTYTYEIQKESTEGKFNKVGTIQIRTNPKPSIKKLYVKKKGRKLYFSWKYNAKGTRTKIYVKTGKKYYEAGITNKSTCSITVPLMAKKISIKVKPYTTIKKKNYYGKYSNAVTIKY